MIEPAKVEGIGVQIGVGAEVLCADAVPPGDVDPRAGKEILVVAGELRTGAVTNRAESLRCCPEDTCRTSQRDGGLGFLSVRLLADVHLRPELAGLVVLEPVGDVGGEAFGIDRRMGRGGCVEVLCGEGRPGAFERCRWPRGVAGGGRPSFNIWRPQPSEEARRRTPWL